MVESKYYDLAEVFDNENKPGNLGKVATQLMQMVHRIDAMEEPVVLECGVNRGRSTGLFANACEQNGGTLISIDILDCHDVIKSPVWTFIQSDDSQQDYILERAPILRDGIDFLYIDSLHEASHVTKLLMLWFPYMKENSYIAVDDVDALPYMRGQHKDDATREIAWREMGEAVIDFFYANQDQTFLEFHYGTTGLAILHKISPFQSQPNIPKTLPRRRWTLRTIAKKLLKPLRRS